MLRKRSGDRECQHDGNGGSGGVKHSNVLAFAAP
jgi:hypothetical protein